MTTNLYRLVETRPGHPNLGKPFYVGIGTAKRPHNHLKQSRSPRGHRNIRLHEVLTSHTALHVVPGIEVIGTFATKDEAGEAEKTEIARWGRAAIDPDGILCNLAIGGQGPDVALMQLPEVRAKSSASQRKRHPSTWANSTAAARRCAVDPEINARRAAATKAWSIEAWADQATAERFKSALKGNKKTPSPEALAARRANAQKGRTPEANAKKAEASRKRWANPEFRARMAAKKTEAWTDPEKRAKMLAGRSEAIAKTWRDPEVRARRIAGIKASGESGGEHGDGSEAPSG